MITFTQIAHNKLDTGLTALARGISDWSPAWPLVADLVRGIAREQFESAGARGASGPWPVLADDYAKAKAKRYPGQPILRATNRLYNSLTDPLGENSVFDPQPKKLTLGTRVEYAIYHQSSGPRARLPRRPIFDFVPGQDDRAIAGVLNRYAIEVARRAGLAITDGL